MNVDLARKIDYYVGIPLCFIGTAIKKAVAFFSRRRRGLSPRNVLFIELSEMGSAVLADPAMRKLRHSLGADLYFAIFLRNSESLRLLGTVPRENIFCFRDSGLFPLAADTLRFFIWTRRNRIDTVIDLELFSRFSALLSGFSGAVRTVGFHAFHNEGLYRGNFLTHKVIYNPHIHIAKNFAALVNAALSDKTEVPYSKSVVTDEEITICKAEAGEQARRDMQRKIGAIFETYDPRRHRLVLFNTNSSDLIPLRRWPEDHYVRLARMILEKYPRVVILLTGHASEGEGMKRIAAAVDSERCISFAGLTEIAELPALYGMSAFMLTNDSGPAHFASVTQKIGRASCRERV